jgi:hypothetical protein
VPAVERDAVTTVSDTAAPAVSRRVERFLDLADRGFPLVWIGLYLLLPVSGWATVMFDSWHDQRLFLEALRSVLADGRADAIDDDVVGPAYIALAAVVHWLGGLSPQDSLVALNRVSYVLAIVAALVLVRVLVRRLTPAPPMVSIAAQFVLVALVFATGTWHWSDVPWSHFLAAFLAVTLYAVRFAPMRATVGTSALVGAVLALLALTRSFEFISVLLAWGFVLALLAALRLSGSRRPPLSHVVAGAVGFVGAAVSVQLLTGQRGFFFLYSGNLDEGGNVLPTENAETPTLSLAFLPVKLVQLFYEPCYYSLCTLSDYTGGTSPLSQRLTQEGGNLRLWSQPLSIQLPSLVLLPVCVVAVAALLAWAVRHRQAAVGRTREIRLLVEMTVASAGLVFGYVASTISGAPHLRYGLARDFLLPALLTGVVAISLGAIGLWLVISRIGSVRVPLTSIRLSPETVLVGLALVVAAGLVAGTAVARAKGLPRIESRQLEEIHYTSSCADGVCEMGIEARAATGRPITIPEPSTLTFGCGSSRPRFTLYVEKPSAGVPVTSTCRDPRLVAAWPTVMGLPPGSYELGFVEVSNAPS